MPLDPHVKALLDEMEEAGARPFEELTVPQARIDALGFIDFQGKAEDVASVEHRFIPGPTADLPVRIYTPAEGQAPFPGLVYFHGSGWVVQNIEVCDTTARALANSTGCVIVTVNYQKAPEHPFPIPFDDAWAGTTWVFEHAAELGIDAVRIGVAGDSAGGNLAAAVALRARDEGAPKIAYQALIYPAVEHGWDTSSMHENGEGYMLTRESVRWCWDHYVQDKSLVDDWRVSPLRASDHSGLPPAFIATAEFDPLRDDGRNYSAKLKEAGVSVTYVEYDGMIHGFFWMQGRVERAKRLHEDLALAVREALGTPADAFSR
jgi:acetyl esterase